ncbi:MAG TPA: fibronectin type III domain-containing protein [Geothrix sp.]|jgi:titin
MRVLQHTRTVRRGLSLLVAAAMALQLACGGGGGGSSAPQTPPSGGGTATAPAAPTGLTATAPAAGTIALAWTDVSTDETGFKVERGASAAGPFTQVATTAANLAAYTDSGLSASTAYYYRVRATNAAGDSAYTAVASATTPSVVVAPAAPSGLTASATSTTSIALAWTDNSANETGFKIERGTSASGPFTQIATALANFVSHADTGLGASTTYYYRVRATNSAGDSTYTAVASAATPAVMTPPAAPTSLAATAGAAGSIALSWTDNAANESGFKVERGASASGPFAQIATTLANVAGYTDSGLSASTTYYYQVRATNSVGDSAYSQVASATTVAVVVPPAAPTNLAASVATATSVSLLWTDNATNETGFKVERGTSATGPFAQIATTTANVASYTDSGLSASTTYYYQVRATNSAGDSAYTPVATVTTPAVVTPPSAPSNLAATAASTSSIGLTWTDTATNETGFKIERSASATGTFTQIGTSSTNVASYNDSGLSAGTAYYYRVRSTNSAGDSAYTAVASATTPAAVTIPAAPSNLTAAAVSTSGITLAWTDNASNESGFKVERSTSASGTYTQIALNAANVVTFSNSGLAASTTYYYRVSATNSAGDSAYSAVASATTQTPAPTSTTVTLYPIADNLIMTSTWDSAVANRVYASGELAVGTNWTTYLDPFGNFMQTYVRAESLVKYDVSALAGKTIESATLTVNRQYYGVNQHAWWIVALASPWSTSTVTWNIVNAPTFLHYTGNQLHLNPPTAITTNYDITPIVSNWASGTFQNQGLWFSPDVSLMPGVSESEAFAFYSRESGSSPTWAPALTVVYH